MATPGQSGTAFGTDSTQLISGILASRIAKSRKKPSRPPASRNRHFCPHCGQNLKLKTFKKHERLFLRKDGYCVNKRRKSKDHDASSSESDGMPFVVHSPCIIADVSSDGGERCIPTLPTFEAKDTERITDQCEFVSSNPSESGSSGLSAPSDLL